VCVCLVIPALNHRLSTDCDDMICMASLCLCSPLLCVCHAVGIKMSILQYCFVSGINTALDAADLTLGEAMVLPEQDTWNYKAC